MPAHCAAMSLLLMPAGFTPFLEFFYLLIDMGQIACQSHLGCHRRGATLKVPVKFLNQAGAIMQVETNATVLRMGWLTLSVMILLVVAYIFVG
jgi:hypothetical protein